MAEHHELKAVQSKKKRKSCQASLGKYYEAPGFPRLSEHVPVSKTVNLKKSWSSITILRLCKAKGEKFVPGVTRRALDPDSACGLQRCVLLELKP